MSLASPIFWTIFPIYFLWLRGVRVRRTGRWTLYLLLSANVLFIASHDWRILLLLSGQALLTFIGGREMARPSVSQARRDAIWWACVSLCAGSVLFAKTVSGAATFGVSFFNLQMLSYIFDIERKAVEPEEDFWLYLSAVSSFLYLSAGPVVRAQAFMRELKAPAPIAYGDQLEALFRIANGLAKKSLGDRLGAVAPASFELIHTGGWLCALLPLLAYTGQFYADFSGYTDIALGLGGLLGIRLPENFRTPYFATSVADFWRRWHITLNEWFRLYFFSPLCMRLRGSARLRITVALFLTMMVIGLWHGFSLNNLYWGIYNGGLILACFMVGRFTGPAATHRWGVPFSIALTFYLVLLGRILSVTPNLNEAWTMLSRLHSARPLAAYSVAEYYALGLVSVALVLPHLIDHWFIKYRAQFRRGLVVWPASFLLLLWVWINGLSGQAFIYEKF